ncbi:MAG: hypothetical protein JWP12_1216 [Bacteroidetes bacterium]|nr:hypothetical protein [Bacteroidota bacterium]
MKSRNFVSLTIAFSFLAISVTGLLLYFGVKSESIETIHVLFGLLFTGFAIFHIWYNFSSLKNYSKNRKTNVIKKEFAFASLIFIFLTIVMCLGFSFIEDLSHAGRILAGHNKSHQRKDEGLSFSQLSTNENVKGTSLHFVIWENEEVLAPSIVIWVADSNKKYIENIFLPAKVLTVPASVFDSRDFEKPDLRKELKFNDFNPALFRKFTKNNPNLKFNFSNATPISSFMLETNTHAKNNFTICLEIMYAGTTEFYYATINASKNSTFLLQSSQNRFIKKGVVIIDDLNNFN